MSKSTVIIFRCARKGCPNQGAGHMRGGKRVPPAQWRVFDGKWCCSDRCFREVFQEKKP